MQISIKNISEADCSCDVLILLFSEDGHQPYGRAGSAISKLVSRVWKKEFHGKDQEVLLMHAPDGIRPERLLFVGLGKKDDVSRERVRRCGGRALTYLRDFGMRRPALSTKFLSAFRQSPADFAEGALLGLYQFDAYRSEKADKKIAGLTVLCRPSADLNRRIRYVKAVGAASAFAKDLINTPANDMTPSDMARAALSLRGKGVSVKVLGKKELEKLGMGAYLAV
ncbi:MAG TPA: M17 family peptidase N-terminal domain-containing protein, partial [Thermodesulfovibrionales bacterium]|nr:M17 family peptidase N-terminal domain-containing protein [Thermodesulfovibrionales bacterium]